MLSVLACRPERSFGWTGRCHSSGLVSAGQRRAAGAEWVGGGGSGGSPCWHPAGPLTARIEQAWLRRQWCRRARCSIHLTFGRWPVAPPSASVLRTTFAEHCRWADDQSRTLLIPPHGHPGQFDYETLRSVAEQVAQRHRVSPNAVRGCAIVLPVESIWWRRCSPAPSCAPPTPPETRTRHRPRSPTPSNRDSTPEHDDDHVATSPQGASRARASRALDATAHYLPTPSRPKRPM